MTVAKKYILVIALLCAVWSYSSPRSLAAPAHFWISDVAVSPNGPNVATNLSIEGSTIGTLYIWGRPETDKKLRNISLNIVALQAGVDFIDASISMNNNAGGGVQRYEYISDASSTPALESEETEAQVIGGAADSIEQIQGFTISSVNANVRGIGGQCTTGELSCSTASDGQDAWLIASVNYNAILGGPATQIHLQIGSHGINHESLVTGDYDYNGIVDSSDFDTIQASYSSTTDLWADGNENGRVDAADYTIWQDNLGITSSFEVASSSSVRFGADTLDGIDEPIYNGLTDRDVTLLNDDPDATITITPPRPMATHIAEIPEPTSLAICLIAMLSFSFRWARYAFQSQLRV